MQILAGSNGNTHSLCSGRVRYARPACSLRSRHERLDEWGKKRWAVSCWWDEVLREYDANLVELWEGVTYGEGVGGNDADDVTKE